MPSYATLRPSIFEGDYITHSTTGNKKYKVTRVKQVKLYATESGTGKSYEMRIEHCTKSDDTGFVAKVAPAEEESTVDFTPGMAVRFKNNATGQRAGVFIITQKTAAGWFLYRLGGADKWRHYHKVPETSIVPVPEINDINWA